MLADAGNLLTIINDALEQVTLDLLPSMPDQFLTSELLSLTANVAYVTPTNTYLWITKVEKYATNETPKELEIIDPLRLQYYMQIGETSDEPRAVYFLGNVPYFVPTPASNKTSYARLWGVRMEASGCPSDGPTYIPPIAHRLIVYKACMNIAVMLEADMRAFATFYAQRLNAVKRCGGAAISRSPGSSGSRLSNGPSGTRERRRSSTLSGPARRRRGMIRYDDMKVTSLPLQGGVDEASAVNNAEPRRAIAMENWRLSKDGSRIEKRLGLSEEVTNFSVDVYGYTTYYNLAGTFCELAVLETGISRFVTGGAWASIHSWSSSIVHPVIPIEAQGKVFVITETDSRMVHHDSADYQIGITAPTGSGAETLPVCTPTYASATTPPQRHDELRGPGRHGCGLDGRGSGHGRGIDLRCLRPRFQAGSGRRLQVHAHGRVERPGRNIRAPGEDDSLFDRWDFHARNVFVLRFNRISYRGELLRDRYLDRDPSCQLPLVSERLLALRIGRLP
ncbi:MAG: hypothetical protein MZV49_24245 [Rhodopseudomonas palustris]|nr:hypothetical protein [Rhodopseudomonas palustris]